MKRIVIRTLAGIVIVVAALGLWGWTLDPEVRADVSIEIARPPADVYALVADMEAVSRWSSSEADLRMEKISDQPKRYRATAGGMESTWEILEERPPSLLRSRMENHSMGVSGEWRTEIASSGAGASRIHHQVRMEFRNPFMRVVSRMLDANKEEMKTLQDLKRYLERR